MSALSVRTRFEVFKRDGFRCVYCGRRAPDVLLECDHIIPRAAGGSDEIENLTTACWDCNHGKADRLLDEGSVPVVGDREVDAAQERLAQAQAYAEAVQGNRELQDRMIDMVNQAWADAFGATTTEKGGRTHWEFEHSGYRFPNEASVRRILRKLPVEEVLEAIDITRSRFYWTNDLYFYKVCWNKATERQGGPR